MNSALKPVLTATTTTTGAQNTTVPTQINNKQMHPQSSPSSTTYGQQSTTAATTTTTTTPAATTQLPQSLVNLPQNNNPNVAHNNQQLLPNPAHQSNHYSLNIPNAPQHYTNNTTIPASNHPVPNVSQTSGQQTQQTYSTTQQQHTKQTTYPGGYQPNLGHPPNPIPPVTQALPATQSQVPPQQPTEAAEKPHSNGTTEAKSPTKPESIATSQENHVATPAVTTTTKEKPPASPVIEKIPENSTVPEQKETIEKTVDSIDEKPEIVRSQSNNESDQITIDEKPIEIEQDIDKNDTQIDDSIRENNEDTATTENQMKLKEQKNSPQKQSPTPRTPTRKSRTPKSDGESSSSPAKTVKNDGKITTPTSSQQQQQQQKSPSGIGKSKRTRTRTQPYQSPLPEIEIITKISSTPKPKNSDDKLIVFYKNEFLAVRNSEGSFYICQAVQNIYKSSPRIRIRWLSQDKNDKTGEVYTPDFYDHTDFDCILTNLNLERVDKGKYRLPPTEKERTDSILKRSLAVEKGEVTSPSLTEEHPDGIDVSLYKEESQLKKRKGAKRRATSTLKTSKSNATASTISNKSPDQSKLRKIVTKSKTSKRTPRKRGIVARKLNESRKASQTTAAAAIATTTPTTTTATTTTTTTTTSRTDRLKRRSDNQNNNKVSPVVDQKKARVLAKVARKTAIQTSAKLVKASTSKVQKSPPKPTTTKRGRKTKRSKK